MFTPCTNQAPSRNPLHREALTLEELRDGLSIVMCREYRISWGRPDTVRERAIIVSEPFRREDKYGKLGTTLDSELMVTIVIVNSFGRLIKEDKYLADMGVVPNVSRYLGEKLGFHPSHYIRADE